MKYIFLFLICMATSQLLAMQVDVVADLVTYAENFTKQGINATVVVSIISLTGKPEKGTVILTNPSKFPVCKIMEVKHLALISDLLHMPAVGIATRQQVMMELNKNKYLEVSEFKE